MTNPRPEPKKPKTRYTATFKGRERAKRALKRLGFGSEENLAQSILLSRSTVAQFFNGQPIQLNSFKRICEKLALKWPEIAELPIQESSASFPLPALEITRENRNEFKTTKSNDKWVLVEDLLSHPLPARDLCCAELSDVELSHADLMSADLRGADLSNADLSHANLRSAYLNGADLSHADLSNADLSHAYLRAVNLSNTNLNEAKVNNTRFGFNQGISALIKLKLSKRGANF